MISWLTNVLVSFLSEKLATVDTLNVVGPKIDDEKRE